jgi:polyhydroxyalkanoate synthase
MSADTDPTRSAAAEAAAAPLDLLLTDAATGMLRRVNPGGSGLRLAAALTARPRLVAGRGTRLAGELARIAVWTWPPAGAWWSTWSAGACRCS